MKTENTNRDTSATGFTEILSGLENSIESLVLAVFFDDNGETIDYHSHIDPYTAKLVSAYFSILKKSAKSRLQWLGKGDIQEIITCGKISTITVGVIDDYGLSAIFHQDPFDGELVKAVHLAAGKLSDEI